MQKDSLNNVKFDNTYSGNKEPAQKSYSTDLNKNSKKEINYFSFDPNTVTFSQLLSLGLSKKVASTLIKFRTKGAKFYKPSDLLKVYGIDSTTYKKLKSYISIKHSNNNPIHYKQKVKKINSISIEINSADSSEWVKLPGIGPVYASRICKFRNYLGGYVQIEQIKEVYNLPNETYKGIYDNLRIDTTLVKYIDINFASIDELKKHPYCNYSIARKIVDYRSSNGSFKSINQLLSDSVLSNEEFKQLSAYYTIAN